MKPQQRESDVVRDDIQLAPQRDRRESSCPRCGQRRGLPVRVAIEPPGIKHIDLTCPTCRLTWTILATPAPGFAT